MSLECIVGSPINSGYLLYIFYQKDSSTCCICTLVPCTVYRALIWVICSCLFSNRLILIIIVIVHYRNAGNVFQVFLSRPLLQFSMWRYWFRPSRYVYGGNRSFAPILRQSRWSLLYDVYWLTLMLVISQRDRNTWIQFRIRIVLFFLNNKQRTDEKWKQQTNELSNNEQNKWTTDNK